MPVPDVDPGLHYRDRVVDLAAKSLPSCDALSTTTISSGSVPAVRSERRHGPMTPTPLWATTTTAQRTARCSGSRTADIAWALIAVAAAAVKYGRLVVAG